MSEFSGFKTAYKLSDDLANISEAVKHGNIFDEIIDNVLPEGWFLIDVEENDSTLLIFFISDTPKQEDLDQVEYFLKNLNESIERERLTR